MMLIDRPTEIRAPLSEVRLAHQGRPLTDPLCIERVGQGEIIFKPHRGGGGNLRCGGRGRVDMNGGKGPWARWAMTPLGANLFSILSVGHRDQAGRELYLAPGTDGSIATSATPVGLELIGLDAETAGASAEGASNGVRLCHGGRPLTDELCLEREPNGDVLFAGGAGNLRCSARGQIDAKPGARGPWARFEVSPLGGDDGALVSIRSVGNRDKAGRDLYLAPGADGRLSVSSIPVGLTLLRADAEPAELEIGRAPEPEPEPEPPKYALSAEERAAFVADGVLVLRGLVPDELVRDALRVINRGLRPEVKPEHALVDERREKPLLDLMARSALGGVVSQLLDKADGSAPPRERKGCQIALRFPNSRSEPPETQWHVDGMKKMHAAGHDDFQLLVGVALSDQPDDNCGNLAVWRGKHAEVHAAVQRAKAKARAAGVVGEGEAKAVWMGERPDLGSNGEQLKLRPGDVVLAHQKIPHRISPNHSPHIRYQVYFRLSGDGRAAEPSLWDGFNGLRESEIEKECMVRT